VVTDAQALRGGRTLTRNLTCNLSAASPTQNEIALLHFQVIVKQSVTVVSWLPGSAASRVTSVSANPPQATHTVALSQRR